MKTELRKSLTDAEIKDYKEAVLKRVLSPLVPTESEVLDLIKDYYKVILNLPLPEVVKVFDSPFTAWKWIQENKCVDKNQKYIEPSDISIESAGYYSFYKFAVDNNLVECTDELKAKIDVADRMLCIGKVFSFSDCVVVAQRPVETHFNSESRLHNENGMSVRFNDGTGFYSLNGIKVPDYVVTTAKENFTKEMILKETNADVRREIIRKIGSEQMYKVFGGTVIDTDGEYELINVDIGDKRVRPYLKMVNPSIDAIHVEGVLPSCKTVREAIAYRNSLRVYKKPIALS